MSNDGKAPTPGSGTRLARLLILAVVFINMTGFSLILPLLPFYGRLLNASAFEVTTLFAAYSLGNIFGEIWWGRLSDRYGRKRILMFTTTAAGLTYIAFAFATHLWLALLIRVIGGFFGGTLGVCQSYIASVTSPEERPRSMGYFGAALNLGIAIGPAVGGVLATPAMGLAGFRLPIFVAAAVSGVAALWTVFVLKESRVSGPVRALPQWGEAFRFVSIDAMLSRLFFLAFIGIGSFAALEAVFGLWTQHNFGWSSHQVGLAFVAVGGTGLTLQLLVVGPLAKRVGEARVIVLGMLALGISMVLQPVIRLPLASVVLMSTLMGGHSIAFPNVSALISRTTPPANYGTVLGLQMAMTALGRIVVPPIFGFVYSAVGPDAPYYACAAIMVFAVIVALQVMRIRDGRAYS